MEGMLSVYLTEKGIETGKSEGIEIGRADGIEIGRVDGIAEKAHKTASKMLKKGYQPQEIADILEMPVSWVDNLSD